MDIVRTYIHTYRTWLKECGLKANKPKLSTVQNCAFFRNKKIIVLCSTAVQTVSSSPCFARRESTESSPSHRSAVRSKMVPTKMCLSVIRTRNDRFIVNFCPRITTAAITNTGAVPTHRMIATTTTILAERPRVLKASRRKNNDVLPPARKFSTASTLCGSNENSVPFYGAPRSDDDNDSNSSLHHRMRLTLQHAWTALQNPERADSVAAVGELTGTVALSKLVHCMRKDPTGRQILLDKPIVSKDTIPYEAFLAEAKTLSKDKQQKQLTFGQAYGLFLQTHGFDPDERDQVKYLNANASNNNNNGDLDAADAAYVMLRYRQNHDFWHTLTGLPPTVLGELGLKWLELFQTGLPVAALSATVGSLSLSSDTNNMSASKDQQQKQLEYQKHVLWNIYLPWARRQGQKLPFGALMNVYYEQEWDTPLSDLRHRLQLEPAPLELGHTTAV